MRDGKIRRSFWLYINLPSELWRDLCNTVGHFSFVFSVISGRLAMPVTSGKAEKFPTFQIINNLTMGISEIKLKRYAFI